MHQRLWPEFSTFTLELLGLLPISSKQMELNIQKASIHPKCRHVRFIFVCPHVCLCACHTHAPHPCICKCLPASLFTLCVHKGFEVPPLPLITCPFMFWHSLVFLPHNELILQCNWICTDTSWQLHISCWHCDNSLEDEKTMSVHAPIFTALVVVCAWALSHATLLTCFAHWQM